MTPVGTTNFLLSAIGRTPWPGCHVTCAQLPHLFSSLASPASFFISHRKKSYLFFEISYALSKTHLAPFFAVHSFGMYYHDVAVIGDSFINRLLNDRDTDRNLDLPHQINVRWYTSGGLTISRMDPILDLIARDFQQVAVLQIGSNDLCQQSSTMFINNLCTRIIPKLQGMGCKVIVLCQLFHRHPGKYTKGVNLLSYNLRIDEANAAMAALNWRNIVFWKHTSVLRSGSYQKMWNTDGVHLSCEGLPHFRRSIRGAIMTTTDAMDRYDL